MEKNRNILKDALRHLPTYTPDDEVWDALLAKLPEAALTEGLSKLKPIDPPEITWDAISNELDKQKKINQLKQFTPEDDIWNKIDETLSAEDTRKQPSLILRWKSWLVAAAAAIFLAFYFMFPKLEESNISYSEEIIQIGKPALWQEDDTEINELLNTLCANNPLACSQPEFKAKQQELDYLDKKKSEILGKMNPYDQNKDLQIMLTKIELEKNEIVKQMISKIM